MKLAEHSHAVGFIEFSDDAEYCTPTSSSKKVWYIAMELADQGTLIDLIETFGPLGERISRLYFKQLLETLEHMHSQGLSHLDLKADNLLFDSKYNLKVWDFGFSSDVKYHCTKKGTLNYCAPEIFQQEKYWGPVTDVFSAGVILFIMVTGHLPFCRASPTDPRYKYFYNNKISRFWEIISARNEGTVAEYSDNFKDLVSSMLSPVPFERPSLSEILQHEWLKGDTPSLKQVQHEFEYV